MPKLPTRRKPLPLLVACASLVLWACTDGGRLVEPETAPEPEIQRLEGGTLLRCVVQAENPSMTCRAEEPDPSDEVLAAIHLGTPFVALISPSVSFISPIQTLVADVSLINTSGQTIGDVAASRAWFYSLPVVTDGDGTVTVDNPDGHDTFIDSEPRPFFQYSAVLAPGDTSATKQWGFKYDGTVNSFEFSVFVQVNVADESAPFIGSISPAVLEAGESATISGFNFSPTIGDNQVTIGGVSASITDATSTQLTIEVPPLPAAECAVDDVDVEVTLDGHASAVQAHRAIKGNPTAVTPLAVGEFVNLFESGDVGCGVELPVTSGEEYFLSVHNVSTDRTVELGLQLEGSMEGVSPALIPAPSFSLVPRPRQLSRAQLQEMEDLRAHIRALEKNRELWERLGPPRHTVSVAAVDPPDVGDTRTFFAPSSGETIDAVVVYSGTHAVVWEDTEHVRFGEMDAELVAIGQEYDDRMHGLLTTYFGNPLAMDPSLDNNGVIYILLVRSGATFAPGLVRTCDFASVEDCERSNVGEIAYIRGPTASEDITLYHRSIRSTVMHETKHITSIAEDLANGQPLEDVALEEATASLSEELWGWDVHGRSQFSNLEWADEPDCFRPFGAAPSGCAEPVSGTLGLFVNLYDRLLEWEGHTQFGSPGWYYLYWWFVRWSVDQSGEDQATFLKSLVSEGTLLGIDNLTDKMGRSFPELFGEFALATMVDDLDGFTPGSSVLDHPSWDSRDIFQGVEGTAPSRTEEFPIVPTEVPFGPFTADMSSLAAGTARIFDLTDSNATGGGTQLLRLRSLEDSGPADPLIRMSIVRVQ